MNKKRTILSRGLSDMFSINARRIPQFMIDIDIHNLQLFDLKGLPNSRKLSLMRLFLSFLMLGLIAFGGLAMVAPNQTPNGHNYFS